MKTNRVRHFFLTYFTYTRAEKHAALFLTGILLVLQTTLWFRYYQQGATTRQTVIVPREFQKEKKNTTFSEEQKPARPERQFFLFDPDTAGILTLQQLGLTERQAESMIRFREKINGFHSAMEVSKVKVLREDLFKQWEPWMRFSKKPEKASAEVINHRGVPQSKSIEINTADTSRLMELPFIGSGRARAIVNYRNRLGGFVRKEQLLEINIIPDSVYKIICNKVTCDGLVFRRMDINHAPADSLKHPYLTRSLARIIVNYREQHGPFTSVNDLEKLPLLEAEILTKLAPYLKINP